MEINKEMAYNLIYDFKKRNISPEDKSDFIKALLASEKISMRQLARRLDISHSTLQDWVSMRQHNKTIRYSTSKNIFALADRLQYLLSKYDIDQYIDSTMLKNKLMVLKNEIEKQL
jgi:transposase-like protein